MVKTRCYPTVFVVMAAIYWILVLPSLASAAPANDNFADAQTISGETASVDGTNAGATTQTGEDSFGNNSVWYTWTAPENNSMSLDTCTSDFDTVLSVYTGSTLDPLTRVAVSGGGCANGSRLKFDVTAGTTYHIRIASYYSDLRWQGNFTLKVQPVAAPPNDHFANARIISGQMTSVDGTNVWATLESGDPPSVFYRTTSKTVWYRWTAPYSGPTWVDTCGSDYDTILGVFTGSTLGALTERAGNDDACGAYGGSKVRFNATKNTTYYILVDGYSGSQGTFTLGVDLFRSIDCRTGQAVCEGTDTKDRLTGTRSKDTIKAYGSEDLLYGRGGDDVAIGGADGDSVDGGKGKDRLYGGDGDDIILTGDLDGDRDSVSCGAGQDWVWREKKTDTVAEDCEEVYSYSSGGGGGY